MLKLPQMPFPEGPGFLEQIVYGRQNHYYLAEKLAATPCRAMFLMQRSSSLLLGPEQGWAPEEAFYRSLISAIRGKVEFYHVVSLEGIYQHIRRPQSSFPNLTRALAQFSSVQRNGEEIVTLRNALGSWELKRSPENCPRLDLKTDRQIRTFLVQHPDGTAEGVVVSDLGEKQVSFHIRGEGMSSFFLTCKQYYAEECSSLTWREIGALMPSEKEGLGKSRPSDGETHFKRVGV